MGIKVNPRLINTKFAEIDKSRYISKPWVGFVRYGLSIHSHSSCLGKHVQLENRDPQMTYVTIYFEHKLIELVLLEFFFGSYDSHVYIDCFSSKNFVPIGRILEFLSFGGVENLAEILSHPNSHNTWFSPFRRLRVIHILTHFKKSALI